MDTSYLRITKAIRDPNSGIPFLVKEEALLEDEGAAEFKSNDVYVH